MNKEQEQEFDRIVDLLISQGDIQVLTDLIPDKIKVQFINDWEDEPEPTEEDARHDYEVEREDARRKEVEE